MKKLISIVFISALALGQLLRLSNIFLPGGNILFLDVLVFLANIYFAFKYLSLKNREKIKIPRTLFYLLPFFLFIILSFLFNLGNKTWSQIAIASAYLARVFNYYLLSIWAGNLFKGRLKIINIVFLAIFSMAVLGLVQYVFFPDMTQLKYLAWDDHYYRLIGPLLDPNFSALLFIFALIILFTTYTKKIWQFKKFNIYQFLFLLLFLSLIFTFSRGSWLVFSLIAMIFTLRKKFKYFLVLLFLGVLTFLLTPKPFGEGVNILRTSTIQARVNNYQQSWEIIKSHPLKGVGYNFLRFSKNTPVLKRNISHSEAGLDSSLLFVWATGGVLAFLSLSYFFLITFYHSFKEKNLFIFLLTLSIFLHSFFYNSFFYPHILLSYLLMLSLKKESKKKVKIFKECN